MYVQTLAFLRPVSDLVEVPLNAEPQMRLLEQVDIFVSGSQEAHHEESSSMGGKARG